MSADSDSENAGEEGRGGPMTGLNLVSIEDSWEESDDDSDVSDSAIASTSNNVLTSVPFTVPGS